MSKLANDSKVDLTTTKRWDKLSRLTSTSTSRPGEPDPDMLHAYSHNALNQRTRATREDGQYWDYGYDDLGQLIKGEKKFPDGTQLPNHDFRYQYDTIGNRKSAISNLKSEIYTSNSLNQYESILHNSSLILHPSHDGDGNQTANGRGWTYEYDGQNRLIRAQTSILRLDYHYDSQSRRFKKEVFHWDPATSSFLLHTSSLFLFDGWNLIAELTRPSTSSGQTNIEMFVWGLDLSGTLQGAHSTGSGPSAGGVGGLLAVMNATWDASTSSFIIQNSSFAASDGNGNISALYDLTDGAQVASYEYDPFGRTIQETSPLGTPISNSAVCPFRFSTKYFDSETGLYYYGYRYYVPETVRWLNRDPMQEYGSLNLYSFIYNDSINEYDILGLLPREGLEYRSRGKYDNNTEPTLGELNQLVIIVLNETGDTMAGESLCGCTSAFVFYFVAEGFGMVHPLADPVNTFTAGVDQVSYFATNSRFDNPYFSTLSGVSAFFIANVSPGNTFSQFALGIDLNTGQDVSGSNRLKSAFLFFSQSAGIVASSSLMYNPKLASFRLVATQAVSTCATGTVAAEGASSRIVPGGGLMASENAGGHLLARYVGQTEAQLMSRALTDPSTRGVASAFFDRAAAEAAASQAIEANAGRIGTWLGGNGGRLTIEGAMSSSVGRVVKSEGVSIMSSSSRFVLVRSASAPNGYYILTGFPF